MPVWLLIATTMSLLVNLAIRYYITNKSRSRLNLRGPNQKNWCTYFPFGQAERRTIRKIYAYYRNRRGSSRRAAVFRIQRLAQAPLQISGIPRIASINLGDRRSPGEAAHELLERRYFGKSFPARF